MEQVDAFSVDAGIQARAAEEAIPYQTEVDPYVKTIMQPV